MSGQHGVVSGDLSLNLCSLRICDEYGSSPRSGGLFPACTSWLCDLIPVCAQSICCWMIGVVTMNYAYLKSAYLKIDKTAKTICSRVPANFCKMYQVCAFLKILQKLINFPLEKEKEPQNCLWTGLDLGIEKERGL